MSRGRSKLFLCAASILVVLINACEASTAHVAKPAMVLIGSTTINMELRSAFGIDTAKPVDFIRWEITFDHDGTFVLGIRYGEGQPNTNGFKDGGETRHITGRYKVDTDGIYRLTSNELGGVISLAKFGENSFQLLTSDDRLMSGGGGWGFTLNRRSAIDKRSELVSRSKAILEERAAETVFVGRTPCVDLGRPDVAIGAECYKVKWKLTLRRDDKTGRPSTYKLETTLNRTHAVEGKWWFVNGTHENPRALFIKLGTGDEKTATTFFVGDDNVIFLTDHAQRMYTGNADFSFSLNRRQPEPVVNH